MNKMNKKELMEFNSKNDVCEKLGLISNGYNYNKINIMLEEVGLSKDFYSNKNKNYNNENPPKCLYCENVIPTDKKRNKFCNHSCSAKYNNKLNIKNIYSKKCLNCGKEIEKNFCNNTCYAEYNKKQIFLKIENCDFRLDNKITESKWIKKYLIEKYGEQCMICGWCEKNKKTNIIPIELNHINGNSENNNLNNVELLCPNCHSLTENYGALNKGNGRTHRKEYRIKQKNEKGFYV